MLLLVTSAAAAAVSDEYKRNHVVEAGTTRDAIYIFTRTETAAVST